MSNKPSLFVMIENEWVGTLIPQGTHAFTFIYSDEWLVKPDACPLSLSMPLQEAPHKESYVYAFFDNLLPDNMAVRQRIQRQFSLPSAHCFDVLSCVGSDCVGALQLLKEKSAITNRRRIQATSLKDSDVANVLRHHHNAPLGMSANHDFRLSIAGAQEKTALLWYESSWQLPMATTPTSHIMKLPIGRIEHAHIDLSDSIENEWLCLKILAAFGLPVCKTQMATFEDQKVLVVERFDRCWNKKGTWLSRLPQEDMCQALGLPSTLKYESDGGPGIKTIMDLLQNSEYSKMDREQFLKTVFLFWVLGAIDGHGKNFSIFLKSKGRFHLTPIYDVISIFPLIEKKQMAIEKTTMAMAVRGKNKHYGWNRIQRRHWLNTAQQCSFPEKAMLAIMEDVFDKLEAVIAQVENELPKAFPEFIAHSIFSGMRSSKKKGEMQ